MYIPGPSFNTLSFSRLNEHGISKVILNNVSRLDRQAKNKLLGYVSRRKSDGLHIVSVMNHKDHLRMMTSQVSKQEYRKPKISRVDVWLRRIGHAGRTAIRETINRRKVGMRPTEKPTPPLCDTCVHSKETKNSCRKHDARPLRTLSI